METRRDVVLRLAAQAEELGYDAFFVAEGWALRRRRAARRDRHQHERIRIGTGRAQRLGPQRRQHRDAGGEPCGARPAAGSCSASARAARSSPRDCTTCRSARRSRRLEDVTRQVRALLDGERIVPSIAGGSGPLRLGRAARGPRADPARRARPGRRAALRRACRRLVPVPPAVSGLKEAIALLEEGAARVGRPRPAAVCPAIPTAVSPDPARPAPSPRGGWRST